MPISRISAPPPNLPPFRIITFDPGVTTGMAYAQWEGGHFDLSKLWINFAQFGPEDHHELTWRELSALHIYDTAVPLEIVYERFDFRQGGDAKKKLELISREYIGVYKTFAQVHSLAIRSYSASDAFGFFPKKGPNANQKLRNLGWYSATHELRHQNDAARHLGIDLMNHRKLNSIIANAATTPRDNNA